MYQTRDYAFKMLMAAAGNKSQNMLHEVNAHKAPTGGIGAAREPWVGPQAPMTCVRDLCNTRTRQSRPWSRYAVQ